MNLRDNEFVEMSLDNSIAQKCNDTYAELECIGYGEDIIENIDILDPDINFSNEKISQTCHYFTHEKFKSKVKCESGFFIINVNCRNFNANIYHLENVLHEGGIKFDIIAINATCLHSASNLSLFDISGYDFCHVERKGNKCSGVALYANNHHDYKVSDNLPFTITDNTEFLTIELKNKKIKNNHMMYLYKT